MRSVILSLVLFHTNSGVQYVNINFLILAREDYKPQTNSPARYRLQGPLYLNSEFFSIFDKDFYPIFRKSISSLS
jgi:hypothetical protein